MKEAGRGVEGGGWSGWEREAIPAGEIKKDLFMPKLRSKLYTCNPCGEGE